MQSFVKRFEGTILFLTFPFIYIDTPIIGCLTPRAILIGTNVLIPISGILLPLARTYTIIVITYKSQPISIFYSK